MTPVARLCLSALCVAWTCCAVRLISADAPSPVTAADDAFTESDEVAEPATPRTDPAAEKYWQAQRLLQSDRPADMVAGRRLLEEAAEMEFTHAQVLLGSYYAGGTAGFPKNLKKAASLFRLAAERGNAFGQLNYGIFLFAGYGVRKDSEKAFQWLSAAAAETADYSRLEQPPEPDAGGVPGDEASDDGGVAGTLIGDPVEEARARAHFLLGIILEQRKAMTEAQGHYVAAATAGPAGRSGLQQAAIQAAVNYAFGNGVPRDLEKANAMLAQGRKLVRRAGISIVHGFASHKLVDDFAVSELEEAVAKATERMAADLQFSIAEQFADRKSKDYNPQEAVRWYELAAESGKPWAMLELAFIYHRGDLGTPNPVKAFAWFEKAGAKDGGNHALGIANTAICLFHGIGTEKDPARAAGLFAGGRDTNIVCYLGAIGQCPPGIVTFEETVELNKLWAVKKKDPEAQYLLGIRYRNGWGVPCDLKEASNWWRRAAKVDFAPACRELGVVTEHYPYAIGVNPYDNHKRAAELYRRGAELGDARSMANLATMYENGRGVPQSQDEAIHWYEACLHLDPKSGMALNNLGTICEARFRSALKRGDTASATADREKMLALYEKADAGGSEFAAYNLAVLNYDGVLGKRDLQSAYTYFDKAAEGGHRESRFRLGQMNENGEGVPVSYADAAFHYRLAALDGHVEALRHLINLYLAGKGVSQDFERAKFWLFQLVQHGEAGALVAIADVALAQGEYTFAVKLLQSLRPVDNQTLSGFAYERLSRCYENGDGVKANPSRAKAYLAKAVKLGNGAAIYRSGTAAMLAGNPAEAIALYEQASADSADACYALGQLHFFGQHVAKDLDKAWRYLRQAAALNHRDALYFLAGAAYNRVPGAPTLDEAIEFAEAAESSGHPKAAQLREKLEKRRRSEQAAPEESTGSRST